MTRIEKTIEIKNSPENVFQYVKDLEKQPEWMPSIKSHTITSDKKEGVGVLTHCITEPGGRRIEWDAEIVEWANNEALAWECKPPYKNKGKFHLKPTSEGTILKFVMEYELPYSLLGKLIDKLKVQKQMDTEVEEGLNTLKSILEK